MEPELAALTSTAAATLVGLMVTDAWASARARVVGFLSRGDADAGTAAEADLEVVRAELADAVASGDQPVLADAEAEWRTRLRRVLAADPGAVAELRALLDELAPPAAADGADGRGAVHNTMNGEAWGSFVQGRDFSNLTIGAPGTPGPPGPPGSL